MYWFKLSFFFIFLLVHVNVFSERLALPLQKQAKVAVSTDGAQTLHAIKKITVDDDYHWQSTTYYSIRINDLDAARDYGRITIGYNHFYSELELEFANVLSPDGEIKALKADAMQERSAGSQDFYEDRTLLVFSLPDIAPGSILEFQYKRKSIKLLMPGIFNEASLPFWYQPTVGGNGARMDPVNDALFEISLPAKMLLKTKYLGPVEAQYESKKSEGVITHKWQWQNLSSIAVEPFMPSFDSLISRVKVSTSRDWSDVDQWTWGLTKDKFKTHESIKEIAASIAPLSATREEKIKAVYAYLQNNIRYVFAHLGRGGYEPHFAHEVIQQGYGDCKDQTVLAIALLKELGIEAVPALVITPRSGRPDMELVALYFDHMIVWVPDPNGGEGIWMDTTADRAMFPGVSNYLRDQSALIIDGKGGKLTSISSQLDENVGLLSLDYKTNSDGHLIVDVRIETLGVYEQNFRNWWVHDNNRETSLQQIVTSIFPDAKGRAAITSEVINAENLWKPFTIKGQFDFGPARKLPIDPIAYGSSIIQAYRIFEDFNALQIPSERKNTWVNNQPRRIEISAKMSADKNDFPAVITSGIDIQNEFFSISQSGKQKNNHYDIEIIMEFPSMDLIVDEYENYYQALSKIDEAGHWSIQFVTEKKQQKLEELVDKASDYDLQSQLDLARYFLDQGEFEKALKPINVALSLNRNNGEIWYVLGLIQGYNAQVEESMKSFEKASKLGYTP